MKVFYLIVSALLYNLSYSPFDYKILIFLSFVILFYVLDELSSTNKIKTLLFFYILIHLFGVSWISQSLIHYSSMNIFLSLFVTLLLIIMLSIPYALIGILYKSINKNNLINILFISALFTSAEYIKSLLFGGFPWLLIGHTQNQTPLNYVYPLFGSYAVSYLVIFSSSVIYKTLRHNSHNYALISITLFLMYALIPPIKSENNKSELISFTIYQPNIYPSQSYNPKKYSEIIAKYNKVLNDNKSSNLIIFPETILPVVFKDSSEIYKSFSTSTSKEKALIVGLFTQSKQDYFNSMLIFSDSISQYNKRKLVPFGEYTPWYDSLTKLSNVLNIPLSNLSHGTSKIDSIPLSKVSILPMICFESTFPNLVNSKSDNEVIVNISNDGWFGQSLAPFQHLQIAQIRALEFNRYILRGTNTGISAVISNQGQLLEFIVNNTEGTLTGSLPTKIPRSFYSEYGDKLILMLIFFSLLANGLSRPI